MNDETKEQLRHLCREILVTRHPTALPLRAIRRHAARELGEELREPDVESACMFLVGLEQAALVHDPLGSTKHFSATPKGITAYERGQQSPQTRE